MAGLTPAAHDVVLCDENVEDIDFDVGADIVGITGFVVHKRRMFEIIDEFRRRGRFIVVGGPFATLCPEELRGKADVVFVGEAEHTWPRFLADYAAGVWQTEYNDAEKPSMLDSPLPRFDLLKVDRYRTMTIQFARGCPFTCEFCDIIVMYGRRPRTKSVAQVMAEVETIHGLGVTNIFVVDDNFIGNKKDAKELLKAIAAWQESRGYPIEFMTEVSLNVAQDDELLQLMKRANFATIFVGIESPRRASLQESGKMQNTRGDLVTSVHRIQAAGIQVMAGMIVGFDSDDPSIFEEQFHFIQEARIPISMTGMLNAMPKTPLYKRLAAAGRLVAESVGDQFVFTNIVPGGMTRLQLYEGYRELLARLYSYRSFRRRAMAHILRRGARLRAHPLAGELALGFRILWDCALRASPRRAWLTLSMLAETALRRPSRVKDALTLALMHKHLWEYVRDTSHRLDALIEELRTSPATAGLLATADPERPGR
ncbi:MAG: B12-binding domain-containing radical SAM protein [Candidatus Rokubacteria bacterium]|nr:B12-binding domain-containing radical SAM protein [Candidatus Rokubacteria bacterium]